MASASAKFMACVVSAPAGFPALNAVVSVVCFRARVLHFEVGFQIVVLDCLRIGIYVRFRIVS